MFDELINDLVKVLTDNAYLSIVLDETIKNKRIQEEDRKLFTKILYGVVERKLYLDFLTKEFTQGKRLKPYLRNALRICIYSMEYLNVKDYFIVNSVIETVKKQDYKGSMLVNAIVRSYQREQKPSLDKLNKLDRISTELSLPLELTTLLHKQYKDEILTFFSEASSINTYRINTLVNNALDIVLKYLNDLNINYTIDGLLFKTNAVLINSILFKDGLITLIDESSYKVAELVNPKENDNILDVCSAPGGKTLSMATLMNNTGSITSCDIYNEKLKLINNNCKRLHVTNVKTIIADGTNFDYQELYDKVLVDAPCSGLGTINHKPDLKYHITIKDLDDIVILQEKILDNAKKYVKVGGELVYSTCTINKNENYNQIHKFIKFNPEYKLIFEEQILPSSDHDGFYMAKLLKEN